MAVRALYLASGLRKQFQDADVLGMGTGGLEMLFTGALKIGAETISSSVAIGRTGQATTIKGTLTASEAATFSSTVALNGAVTLKDNTGFNIGSDSDWSLQYDETTDDALELTGATAAAATAGSAFTAKGGAGEHKPRESGVVCVLADSTRLL